MTTSTKSLQNHCHHHQHHKTTRSSCSIVSCNQPGQTQGQDQAHKHKHKNEHTINNKHKNREQRAEAAPKEEEPPCAAAAAQWLSAVASTAVAAQAPLLFPGFVTVKSVSDIPDRGPSLVVLGTCFSRSSSFPALEGLVGS
eukprot:3405888-Rhodomonas_salina.2